MIISLIFLQQENMKETADLICVFKCDHNSSVGEIKDQLSSLMLFYFLCICRCIKTFEVEFRPEHKEFSRINPQNTIFTSYVYSPGKNSF